MSTAFVAISQMWLNWGPAHACMVDWYKNRIKAAWQKWKDLAGVLCDAKMQKYLKGKVYKTMIRPVLIYGAEAWTVTRREEGYWGEQK